MATSGDGTKRKATHGERIVPILFGADILIYSYAREFMHAYGVKSRVLCANDVKVVTSSKYVIPVIDPEIEDVGHLLDVTEKLVEEAASEGVPVLLGSGDWYAEFLSTHKERLAEVAAKAGRDHAVIPYVDIDMFQKIMHKDSFYDLCDEVGVPHPKTVQVDVPTTPKLPSDEELGLGWPVILKPSDSAAWHYAEFEGKEKVSELPDRASLDRLYAAIRGSSYDKRLILQDRIPGDDTVLYSITVFCDRGRLLRSTIGHVLLQDHDPMALGNPVCIMDTMGEPCHQMLIDCASRIVERLGYTGYGNFDVMHDVRDDSYRFLEMNARPGRNSYYVSLAGESFVKPIVDTMVHGQELEYRDLSRHFLFCAVPTSLIKRYVRDKELRERAFDRIAKGAMGNPLADPDDTAGHALWEKVTRTHQITKFARNYKI